MARYAFISRLGSVAYVAVTYDENGVNLPSNVDGNKVEWSRIEAPHGEVFSLLSTADMERDLHEAQIHITETRTKPRATFGTPHRSER
jgi:hypothetical protein